jgi:hypothetical protein
VVGEGLELGHQRVHLAVIAADVVDDPERGVVAGQRAIGLAGFRGHWPVHRARQEAAARAFARQRGAAQHGGGHARLAGQPAHHAGDRALAAGPRDGDARPPRVHHLGQQRGARDPLDPEPPRGRISGVSSSTAVEANRSTSAVIAVPSWA